MSSSFEVIRVIQQNSGAHIIMDCVEGELLGEYILRSPNVNKELLFSWCTQLITQLKCIEKVRGASEYRFLTPFYIVIKADQSIALLNMKSKINQKHINRVSQYSIMNRFYPENGKYSDIYSFGRSIQFILAKTNLSPQLTLRETSRFKHLISKCLTENPRKQYKTFQEIESEFPIQKKKNIIIPVGIFVILLIAVALFLNKSSVESEDYSQERIALGIIYFSFMEEYDKSLHIFQKIEESEIADFYMKINSFMLGQVDLSEKELQELIEGYERDREFNVEEKYGLVKALAKIDSSYSKSKIKEFAADILAEEEICEVLEIREILAGIYFKEKEYEAALAEQEVILKESNAEEIYSFMVLLYEKCEMQKEALELCKSGLRLHDSSEELMLNYVRLVCQEESFSKKEKEAYLKEIIPMKEIIAENKRFTALKKVYGIHLEGEKIWLEE